MSGLAAAVWQKLNFQLHHKGHRVAPELLRPRPAGAQVLLYHNVEESEGPLLEHLGITVKPADFEDQIRFLTTFYHVLPFSRIVTERHHPEAVAITFDDGFLSVLTNVLPVIERYDCPIKLYITTDFLTGIGWPNKLSYLLGRAPAAEMEDLTRTSLDLPVGWQGVPSIFAFIACFNPERTPSAIDRLYASKRPEPARRLYLNEAEVRQLARHPLVELGSHTKSHAPVRQLSPSDRIREVVDNHCLLNEMFDNKVHGFCLPFGSRAELLPAVLEVVRRVDSHVVTAYGGRLDDALVHGVPEIKRIGVWGNLGTLWYRLKYPL